MAKRISELDNVRDIDVDDLLEIAIVDESTYSGFASRNIRYGDFR